MLLSLLRTYLAPYKRPIALILGLQLIQTLANLYLPGLNADIIDKGIVTGDTAYILQVGLVMLLVSLIQIVCTILAVYYGAKTAMALGRDLRRAVFTKVETFAAREVAEFGAPTLITRSTNDVQQVQMIVFMTFTFMVAAPIMAFGGIAMALRQDVKLSGLLVVVVPILLLSVGLVIRQMRPLFRVMQVKIDNINGVMREQIMGIRVIRAFVKERYEAERFGDANRDTIAYGADSPSEETLLAAATAANVDHFVRTFPDGYDTVIDDEGTNVSAGQRQLLTIARAFLANPSVLVLDEATSSVDTRTEALVQHAMAELRTGRTSFVIAHRAPPSAMPTASW